ncbi:MAG: ATP-dependent sacrificial sulfur transferase LarE [Acidimicrobiales bacterium]
MAENTGRAHSEATPPLLFAISEASRKQLADDGLARLQVVLGEFERVVVAFSGGADSALVAAVATRLLGKHKVLCATAVSPSLAPEDLSHCALIADEWDLRWVTVATHELDDPTYVRNGPDRCYHCKRQLMNALSPLTDSGRARVVLGVNLDDLSDDRPGQIAAAEQGAAFPLVQAGLDKALVREVSQALGLRTWDRPASACLASRVPHGTPVTVGTLNRVASAESALRRLGFNALRVRHYGDTARVELPLEDLDWAVRARDEIVTAVRGAGYSYVTLDLEGLRSGNLSRAGRTVREAHL